MFRKLMFFILLVFFTAPALDALVFPEAGLGEKDKTPVESEGEALIAKAKKRKRVKKKKKVVVEETSSDVSKTESETPPTE